MPWGTVAGRQVAFALLALVGGRRLMLCSEALLPIRTAADGQNLHSQLIAAYAAMTPDELVSKPPTSACPATRPRARRRTRRSGSPTAPSRRRVRAAQQSRGG